MEEYKERARAFVSLLKKNNYTKAVAMFNSSMKSALSKEQLNEAWELLIQQSGDYQDEISIQTEVTGQFTSVILTLNFSYIPMDIKLTFNPKKEMIDILEVFL